MTDVIKCNNCGTFVDPEKSIYADMRITVSSPKAWDHIPNVIPVFDPLTKIWGGHVMGFDLCEICFNKMMESLEK